MFRAFAKASGAAVRYTTCPADYHVSRVDLLNAER